MINGWQQGADGITYLIEYADKDSYSLKKYWTPYAQDSIKEALIVENFMTDISTLLDNKGNYERFKDSIPKKNGCYTNGGMSQFCYISNNYSIGYTGSSRLLLGYNVELAIGYIGNQQTDFGLSINHQFNIHGGYDFYSSLVKWKPFIRKTKDVTDFDFYNYRLRKSDEISNGTKFQIHNILYGINFSPISIALGINFLSGTQSKTGGTFMLERHMSDHVISLSGKVDIYKNQIDYKLAIYKIFNMRVSSRYRYFSTSLYYESFAKNGSVGWSLSTYLQ
ncbi:MAG: hypothetical protein ACK5MK_14860 [Dysgonomonas sp.]